jgi:hypothetical protein
MGSQLKFLKINVARKISTVLTIKGFDTDVKPAQVEYRKPVHSEKV